jgi:hypothetical protein
MSSGFLKCAAACGLMAGLAVSTASAAVETYYASLNGAVEAPPNNSAGVGTCRVDIDRAANTMRVRAVFSGLTGTTTVCHIHGRTAQPNAGTAGVATPTPTFPGFPSGVRAGTYDRTFDMTLASSYNSAFVTNNGGTPATAATALFNAIAAQSAYLNVHSTTFGGGEIRGFFALVCPPDFNRDGFTDFFDFDDFVTSFTNGDASADFNLDGFVDFFDFDDFVLAFETGC